MGQKTFRWEDGGDVQEAKFNYSQDENAQAVAGLVRADHRKRARDAGVERALRYDKLGVYQALLNLETLWNAKRLVGSAQFLPLLDRVAKNEAYLHMARERARRSQPRSAPPRKGKVSERLMKLPCISALPLLAWAQSAPPTILSSRSQTVTPQTAPPRPAPSEAEQQDLMHAVNEGANSSARYDPRAGSASA